MRVKTLCLLFGVAVFISTASASRLAVPGDSIVECISVRQLGAGDDFPDMWEYVYDVVGTTDAGGQNHGWTRDVTLEGFDGTLVANQFYSDYSGYVGLTQRWDDHTTGGYLWWWGGYQLRTEYPSYWDEVSPGVYEWALPDPGDPNAVYGMLNQWHSGEEYDHETSFWYRPGTTDADGIYWQNASPMAGYYGLDGLLLTFRIVHPLAPGIIEWTTYSNDTLGNPEEVYGTVLGPGWAPFPGDFDADADVDDADIDLLGDFIRVSMPYDPLYDISADGVTPFPDGVIDKLDLDYLIRFLVETPMGVGTEYGDFNLDGAVDYDDEAILLSNFGQTGWWSDGNANPNCDVFVDCLDWQIWHTYLPEPATMSLLAMSGLAVLRRRKNRRIGE